MNPTHNELATLLHRSAALWRARLDERLRPWEMTQTTWRTLWLLRAAEQRYNQSTLAARLGIETPTLVHILDRMEALGLLRREVDSHNRRQKLVDISERGRQLADEIEGEVVAVRAEMLAGIGDSELQAAIAVLKSVLVNAGADV